LRTDQELSKVGQILERYLSEQGITVPFPNYEELLIKLEDEEQKKKNYKNFKEKLSPEDKEKYNKMFNEKD
jgi:small-conductance mechanosensitive channel